MSSFFKETHNFLGSINKLQEREGFEIEVDALRGIQYFSCGNGGEQDLGIERP